MVGGVFRSPSISRSPIRLLAASVVAVVAMALTTEAQITLSNSSYTGWTGWTIGGTSTLMTDAAADQQTGQGQDDFVGDGTNIAFAQTAGTMTIGGVTRDYLAFRARMNTYDANGFSGILTLGLDLDGDGDLEILVSADDKSQTKGIRFATPGTDLNNSPSTTSWGSWSNPSGTTLFDANTYNYQQTTVSNFGGTADALVSFAVTFSDLQAAIRALGGTWTNFNVTYGTMISFIAFSTTQGNSINQDLVGAAKISSKTTTTFSSLGAITPAINAYGVVPEPATYAQMGALLLAGGFVAWRRHAKRKAAAAQPADSRE